MNWRIIKLGKIGKKEIKILSHEYQKRTRSWGKFEIIEIKDPGIHDMDEVLKVCQIQSGNFVILLDERGKKFNSPSLALFFKEKIENPAIKQITLVVGGSYGVSEDVRKKVDFMWSLSDLVFPNEIAWLIMWEQLYRSWSILNKTGYHHE